jgi:hypothetical protein
MYATKSRPDIKFATSLAATKSSNPTEEDYQRLVHIMKYLYVTKDLGLVLHPVENYKDPLHTSYTQIQLRIRDISLRLRSREASFQNQ